LLIVPTTLPYWSSERALLRAGVKSAVVMVVAMVVVAAAADDAPERILVGILE
jgi:hypothetical protein